MLHGPKKTAESYKWEILFEKALGIVHLTHNALLRPGTNICVDDDVKNCQVYSTKKATDYMIMRFYKE